MDEIIMSTHSSENTSEKERSGLLVHSQNYQFFVHKAPKFNMLINMY